MFETITKRDDNHRQDMLAIPQALKSAQQWLCWKYGERDGKKTKIPIDPITGRNTSAPEAAWSFEECCKSRDGNRELEIGFSLKNGFVGIDYDHVLDEEGRLKNEHAGLMDEIRALNSYTEVSPSGTGLHVIVYCLKIPAECTAGKHTTRGEIYSNGRFFTVTGNIWSESPKRDVTPIPSDLYRRVYDRIAGKPVEGKETKEPTAPARQAVRKEEELSDADIVRLVKKRVKGAALWSGDISVYSSASASEADADGYPSASEADAALMCILAFYTRKNREQMRRLFLQSGLGSRDKAQQRPEYIERTIDNACKKVTKVYDKSKWKKAQQETKNFAHEKSEKRYTAEVIEKATKLANDPNKLDILLDLFGRRHIGDRDQAHLCLLCALLIRVANASEGTDVVVSGERSAGKTNFVNTISKIIPHMLKGEKALITGEQSDKWITRACESGIIGSQCVMIFDDTYKSEAATLWQKQMTTWDITHTYQTLEQEGKEYTAKIYRLPQKTIRIYVNVDDIRDEQETSRILNLHLQNSPERDSAIRDKIWETWKNPDATEQTNDEFKEVQCMWELLPTSVKVKFPSSFRIIGNNGEPRLYQRVLSLIASQAALRAVIGQTEITTTREDAESVVRLMNSYLAGETGGGAEAMDAAPKRLLNALISRGKDWRGTVSDLARKLGIEQSAVHRGIYGRKKLTGTFTTGLINLGYVRDEEVTETTQTGGMNDPTTKRRARRERIVIYDHVEVMKRMKGIQFQLIATPEPETQIDQS